MPRGGAASQFARLVGADAFENRTMDGATTENVLAVLAAGVDGPDVVTLTCGGNDFLRALWAVGSGGPPGGWPALVERPLANLVQIAAQIARFEAVTIVNTVYDPSDGDDEAALAGLGLPTAARAAFTRLNDGIRGLAVQHGFLLSDLEGLFAGHGMVAWQPWIVRQIEPNYAGATAIAAHWLDLYRAAPHKADPQCGRGTEQLRGRRRHSSSASAEA